MKTLRYLKYIVKHKWFVFRAGLLTKAPLWRLMIHDWSKFLPSEFKPYREHFYGEQDKNSFRYLANKTKFERAWLAHLHRNKHHWQYWLLRNDTDGVKKLVMPEGYMREMVADWFGAGRAITGKWDCPNWYRRNALAIELHPTTRKQVEKLIAETAMKLGAVCQCWNFMSDGCDVHGSKVHP